MITKWAESIANKLAELSGENVSADQLEIHIYGLECFFNTFITVVLLIVWGFLSHTLSYTLIWVIAFSLLRHYTGGAHAPTQLTCILGSFFLGCLDKWAMIYLKPTILGYVILILMCMLFAPTSNHKICLSAKQKWMHKLISVIIVSIGLLLFYKIGDTKMNTTFFYSFCGVIILMIVETLKNQTSHITKISE